MKPRKQALSEKDLALAQANRHKDELFQKLAEKDREIAKWKAAHDEMVDRNKLLRDRPDLVGAFLYWCWSRKEHP